MKQKLLSLFIALGVAMFFTTIASATTYTYEDDFANWPGYNTNTADQLGSPTVGTMTVDVDGSGYLTTVSIEVENRRLFDSLYINTEMGSNYQDWDFYVVDNSDPDDWDPATYTDAGMNSGLYSVDSGYTYVTAPAGRTGHPSGIVDDDYLDFVVAAYTFDNLADYTAALNADAAGAIYILYENDLLTYNFTKASIEVGLDEKWVIGYTPWCANDVTIGTEVPEPATIALLGMGLLGVAGISRRKRS